MPAKLTPREKVLLTCIAKNYSISECAKALRISKSTVAVMRCNIRRALGDEAKGPNGLYIWATKNQSALK